MRGTVAPTLRRPGPQALVPAVLATIVAIAPLLTLVVRPRPLLLWNTSASSPKGLYAITKARRLEVGDMVVAWPPPAARSLADQRHYLPATVPLVKHVAAIAGNLVCAKGSMVSVNGRITALRRRSDPAGRALPMGNDPQTNALAVRARSAMEAVRRLDHEPGEVDPELLRKVEEAFGNIPPKQRNIFLAHRVEKMPYAEIARRTGLTVKQVERQMAKVIYKLHKQLEGERLHWWERWF